MFCRTVIDFRISDTFHRDGTRDDAVIDRDLVVEVVRSRKRDLLVGIRRIRAVGACACAHRRIDIRFGNFACRSINICVDVRRCINPHTEGMAARVCTRIVNFLDFHFIQFAALQIAVIDDMVARAVVEER